MSIHQNDVDIGFRRLLRDEIHRKDDERPSVTNESSTALVETSIGTRIFNRKMSSWRRLSWAIVAMASVSLCGFQSLERIANYFRFPTTLVSEFGDSNGSLTRFPLITFCPHNGFHNQRLYDLRVALARSGGQGFQSTMQVADLVDLPGIDLVRLWNYSGYEHSDYITNCEFGNGQSCMDDKYWITRFTVLGKCNTLYIAEAILYEGPSYGIFVQIKDLFKDPALKDGYGIQLRHVLHTKEDDVTYLVGDNGRYCVRNNINIISYVHKMYKGINSKKRPCFDKQNHEQCKRECFDRFFISRLNCSMPFMSEAILSQFTAEELPVCSTSREFSHFVTWVPILGSLSRCRFKCGQSCESTVFDSHVDGSKSDETEVSHFRILPRREGVTVFREEPTYNIFQLFCDFGALFGLYLGISLLTVVEFLEGIVGRFLRPSVNQNTKPTPK